MTILYQIDIYNERKNYEDSLKKTKEVAVKHPDVQFINF